MIRTNDQTLLEKLLKTRYPLTNYLHRQQQFLKVYSATQTGQVSNPSSESIDAVAEKQKVSIPPSSPSFNVPDTLDFNASEYDQNDEMDHSSIMDDIALEGFDETLFLKKIDNQIHENTRDLLNEEKLLTSIQRSSNIQIEFSPYENDSPVHKAIQNALNIINK